MSRIVTLTTDFGDSGAYVGIMKGVILTINPSAALVDLSHTIPPQDIRAGQFVLQKSIPYFPPGAVHVVVIDPGVGTARREIVVHKDNHIFVGPDNGVLTPFLEDAEVFQITERKYCLAEISSTFHGRDIFASVAGHLSAGVAPAEVGSEIRDPVSAPLPAPRVEPHTVTGEVLFIDHFGNLITNIPAALIVEWDGGAVTTTIGERTIRGIVQSYAAPHADPGALVVLAGSTGHLEVAAVNGSAAALVGGAVGSPVYVRR